MAVRRLAVLVATAGLLLAAAAAPAAAAVDADTAARQIGERFDVEVLNVRSAEIDGRKVWLLTVMQPAGSGNATFRVHQLAVDQETGELVPSFRHHADGHSLPPPEPGGSQP